jgi:hypothetical protein
MNQAMQKAGERFILMSKQIVMVGIPRSRPDVETAPHEAWFARDSRRQTQLS